MDRYLVQHIKEDLREKMVFLAGPRQVGKTHLASAIEKPEKYAYFSWDKRQDRKLILRGEWPQDKSLIILDELHKYRRWKTFIKGEYDKRKSTFRFIVTGSARLDIYRKGGDSLQGRYELYRLHPFSVSEVVCTHSKDFDPFTPLLFPTEPNDEGSKEALKELMRFGGFPEPFLAQSDRKLRRWQNNRLERFFREDIRDLERLPDLSGIEILASMLPERVGSLLSLNSLREDLEVSFKAIKHWMDILERLYFLYRLYPYGHRRIRSLKKEPKMYLWDWSVVLSESSRFENLIASHLLKFCHYLRDYDGRNCELQYLRDVDKREVDFLVTCNGKPWFAVEAKTSDEGPASALHYFAKRLNIPFCYQVVLNGGRDFVSENIRVLPASKFLMALI